MQKYVKKPIPIEAEPYRKGLEDGFKVIEYETGALLSSCASDDALTILKSKYNVTSVPVIKTLEGVMEISPTDYIITKIKGERYPCKKDIFEESYMLADEVKKNISDFKLGIELKFDGADEFINQLKKIEEALNKIENVAYKKNITINVSGDSNEIVAEVMKKINVKMNDGLKRSVAIRLSESGCAK